MTRREVLERALEGIASCHHVDNAPALDDVAEITDAWWDEGCYGPEHSCALVARLKDGRWVAIEEGEDTTGHGCQCSGNVTYFDTRAAAIRLGIGTNTAGVEVAE